MRGHYTSGKKKEPKPKLLGPDIFGWGESLLREGEGGQKVRYAFRNPGKPNFWAGYPGILAGISLRKTKFVFNFWPLRQGRLKIPRCTGFLLGRL